jgi:hypothetical protein
MTTYVLEALRAMRASGAGSVEVRENAQERWNAALQERLRRTVWILEPERSGVPADAVAGARS